MGKSLRERRARSDDSQSVFVLELCLSLFLLAACAVKRTDGEVHKDNGYDCIDKKPLMAGAGSPVCTQAVHALREKKAEECEEEACNFKPEDASGMYERSPDGLAEFFRALFCASGGFFPALSIDGSILLDGLHRLRCTVAQHTRSDAHADA